MRPTADSASRPTARRRDLTRRRELPKLSLYNLFGGAGTDFNYALVINFTRSCDTKDMPTGRDRVQNYAA